MIFHVTYWPLAAWSPLLALVTLHYYRRRHGHAPSVPRPTSPTRGARSSVRNG
ncbi:hypothetical protein AB0I81_00985 [Nonomuraea sp. NPDC050404]|uniref:hypothetical protein n=1 Tax=Nonomuraea sp. NPDC050404 TaxID=3155783 RepID=UPI0033CF05AE